MKKIALLLSFMGAMLTVQAQQLSLTGTSYTQNFNGIASGLPVGWHVFTGATASSLGTVQDTSASRLLLTPTTFSTKWTNTSGAFKNFASANNSATYSPFAQDTSGQAAATDRALGVRQVSNTSTTFPGTDSGAAFALAINNTTGLTAFNMTFKLQSLDSSSPRVTAWKVDYGIGAIPTTFTQATATGTLTTGGNTYANNTVTVNFGSGLNNQNGIVWIRIVTLNQTTGAGNRGTAAIDDVTLSWTGSGAVNNHPNIVSLTPANNSTTQAVPGSNLVVTFDRAITKGTSGSFYIKNRTTQATQTIAVTSSNVTVSGKTATISGVTLVPANVYHVTFDSVAFDTAGFKSAGIYDTTAWKFTVKPSGIAQVHNMNQLPLQVIGQAGNGHLIIAFDLEKAAVMQAVVFDMAGREVFREALNGLKGENRITLKPEGLQSGLYLIRISDGTETGTARTFIQ